MDLVDFLVSQYGVALLGLAGVLIAALALLTDWGSRLVAFFKPKPPPAAPLSVEGGAVVFSLEDYRKDQEALRDRLTTEIEQAEGEKRLLLLEEKAAVEAKLADLETAFAQAEETIKGLREAIAQMGNDLDPNLRDRAQEVLDRGDFDEAERLLLQLTDHGEMEVAKTASAYFQRGKIAEEQVRWLDASDHYKRAADLASNPDRLAKAGAFLWRAGRSGEAVRYQEDLLAIQKREAGEAAPETAAALNNLAASYRALGRFEEAEMLYAQALEIDKATIGEGHPDYATDLNNLALLLRAMGRFEEAEPLFRQAFEIDKATIGEGHPAYAIHRNNLAALLQAMGRFEEAEPLYDQAIAILQERLGPDHPNTKTGIENREIFRAKWAAAKGE